MFVADVNEATVHSEVRKKRTKKCKRPSTSDSSAQNTRSVNKVMRLIQYNSVLTFKLQIEFVPFKIVPLGGYTPPETFPLFIATLVVANRNRF